jgi:hypothetical protein
MRRLFPSVPALLAASFVLGTGCRKEDVRVYQAPRDEEPATVQTPPRPSGAQPSSARGSAPWVVPDGWTEQPSSGMRVASYAVKAADGRSADISVVALQGEAGGELMNVNRWRNQVGLDALLEDQLAGARSVVPAGGRQVVLYEFAGEKAVLDGKYKARTLAAILPAGEMTVFFKITGEDALVAGEKPKFLAWLRSVETGDGGQAGSDSATSQTPPPVAAPPESELPHWELPSGWREAGARPMRLASFEIPDPAGAGDVSVSSLVGDGGGLLANVNRWRGQVGLPPLDEAALKSESAPIRTAGDDSGILVDLPGAEKRILGAVISNGGKSWFFKLTASNALVARERPAFEAFVRSVRF